MNKFISAIKAFAAEERGITAIEYGLMAALIGLALSTGAGKLGTSLTTAFETIGNAITNHSNSIT
jgi:pilus assembly protein Flp/PilA